MTHDLKYIIKRIIISVGIILVLSFLKSIFIMDVQAMEYPIPEYYMEDTNNFCKDNSNKLQSNFANVTPQCSAYQYASLTLHYYSQYIPSLQSDYPYYINDVTLTAGEYGNYTFNYRNLYNLVGIDVNLGTTWQLKSNQIYSLLIRIDKEDSIYYQAQNNDLKLEDFKVYARDNQGTYSLEDKVKINEYKYQIGRDVENVSSIDPGGQDGSFNYILINFETLDLNENNGTNYMNQISLFFNKIYTIDEVNYVPNDQSIYTLESDGEINFKLTLIEGKTEFYGECNGETCFYGIEYFGDLDLISGADEELFQKYEQCDNLDIACHVRNIKKGIDNVLVRIENAVKDFFRNITKAIQDLFIPNFNDMKITLEELEEALMTKLGFIWESEQYFVQLINRFSNLQEGDIVINIPRIEVPNFDFEIIHAQTWELSKPFNENNTLHTFYNLYKTLISGVFIFLFINHARRRLGTLLNTGESEGKNK